jgi:hypothetical protein
MGNTTETAKLTPMGGNPDQPGFSVAISGNTVVAGRGGDEAAYVFVEPATGWSDMTQTAKLTSSDDGGYDDFGFSVAINGDAIAVGAIGATIGSNPDQGAVYLFVQPATGWRNMTQTAKLTASDGTSHDEFGISVAISGETVVAGEYYNEITDPPSGAAYVFVEPTTGWVNMTQTAELVPYDGAPGDEFGGSVAISSDTVVAGEYNNEVLNSGAAYVFGPTQIPFSHFSGRLTIDSEASVLYLNASFELGASSTIDPPTQLVTLSVGGYSVVLPAGSFVQYKTGYVYQETVNHIFLCVYIKFTNTPAAYQLLVYRKGGTLPTTSPVPVTLSIGDNSGTTQMKAKFD